MLEVIHPTPMLDKLDVYRGFGVPEVWLFQDGAFQIHRLSDGRYTRVDRSTFLPELDFAMIAELTALPDQHDALRALRERI